MFNVVEQPKPMDDMFKAPGENQKPPANDENSLMFDFLD